MSDYDNTNRGALWKNRKMREGHRDPQYTGSINVDGVDYFISAWRKGDGTDTQPVFTLSVRRDDRGEQAQYQPKPAHAQNVDPSDEIPF